MIELVAPCTLLKPVTWPCTHTPDSSTLQSTQFTVFSFHSKPVSTWLQRNGLRLNTLKTKSMLIHSSRKVTGSTLELSANGSQVEQVCSFKFLGVTINDTLTWSDHINTVCDKVSRNLNLLRHLSWFLPQPFLFLFLRSYILPSLTTATLSGPGAPSLYLIFIGLSQN